MIALLHSLQLVTLLALPQPSDWLARPTAQDMIRNYPERAISGALGGDVVMNCKVGESLRLEDCKVVSETPVHVGFGAAALKLAPLYVLRPGNHGTPSLIGTSVSVPVKFRLGPTPASQTTV